MAKKKKKKSPLSILLVLLIIAVLAAGGLYLGVKNYNNALDPASEEIIDIDIESGSGTTKIAKTLEDAGIIRSANIFKFKTKFNGLDGKYQAGHYSLSPSMTMEEIMEALQSGKLLETSFTIPEGYTLAQVAEKLVANGILATEDEFYSALEDDYDHEFLPTEGYPIDKISAKGNRLEGYLFPETYRVYSGASAHTIIETMLTYFEKNVYDKLKSGVPEGYSFHKIVTLASIIEKECGAEKDRKTISGVFWNRLNYPMKLESDVTILYALPEEQDFSTKFDSPYNTYIVDGLPAGPICSPSLTSIEAALNPESHNYYYFVLKGNGTGECYFATTYEEHLINVEKYRNAPYKY